MNPERWQQVKLVFHATLDLEPAARNAYLAEACSSDDELRSEVEALLASSDEAEDFIERPAMEFENHAASVVGCKIGPYRVIELIGEGGMGAVYRSVREDDEFHQQVAIKLVKRGMDTDFVLRRFRTERQILARLNHPNIARLLDGGVTGDGLPYFVMEYLPGTPINEYCEQHFLPVEDRLRLFLPVCDAVLYAHQNLVVHRDLKATNILVTPDGVPKLLDFGIAKLLDRGDATVTLVRMMTPDYSSPEQIRGETITTASDVYSLGVLLFEISTGQRPFHLAGLPSEQVARVIEEQDPPRPSSLRRLPSELDNIILKAMHKEPRMRYASVEHLAEDLRRHLEGRTVNARPATFGYRAAKFIRRNRAGVIAGAIAGLALLTGLGATVWQFSVARAERDSALRRFYDVRDLANSFLFEIDGSLVNVPGTTRARELLVKRVVQYLDMLAKDSDDPSLRRELAVALEKQGEVEGSNRNANVGDAQASLASYERALRIYEILAARDAGNLQAQSDLARAHSSVSDALVNLGHFKLALDHNRTALSIRETILAAVPSDPGARRELAAALRDLGSALANVGDWGGTFENRHKSYEILKELERSDPYNPATRRSLAIAAKRMGRILVHEKHLSAALPYYREALALETDESAQNPGNAVVGMNLSFTHQDMGNAMFEMQNFPAALESFQKAHEIRAELASADPRDARSSSTLSTTCIRLGQTLLKLHRDTEGLNYLREALRIREALATVDAVSAGARGELAEAHAALGDAYHDLGRGATARLHYSHALPLFRELRDQGRLNASLAGEPERIAKQLGQ